MLSTVPDAGEQATCTAPSTRSVAVGDAQVAGEPGATVMSEGMPEIDGGVVSRTATVNDPELPLPRESAALQLTSVSPIANIEPLAGLQLGVTGPSTASTALAWYRTEAPPGPVASIATGPGSPRAGGTVSTTVTENITAQRLPCASMAAQVTLVVPMGTTAPLAGEQLTATLPSTTSVAVGGV